MSVTTIRSSGAVTTATGRSNRLTLGRTFSTLLWVFLVEYPASSDSDQTYHATRMA